MKIQQFMLFNKKPVMRYQAESSNFLFNHRFLFDVPKGPTVRPAEGEEPARREKTAIITEVTEVKGTKQVERHDLADKKAAEEIAENKEPPPDAVHKDHLEKITAISEEVAKKDREKIASTDIKTIRFNTRLLKEKAPKEKDSVQAAGIAAGIKEETQRRIKVYTGKCEKDWYTLDYASVDAKRLELKDTKNKLSHENNIGLGDFLLDPDIKTVLVKKANGEIIIAHRGTVPARKTYAGRLGFLDENNDYVATHTGDQFRIIKNELTDFQKPEAVKKYLDSYKTDEKIRQENEKNFDNEMHASEDQDVYYTDANLDPNKSVVEQIKLPLSAYQRQNAEVIERVFKSYLEGKNLLPEAIAKIIAAAIVNAYKESGLNAANKTGDGGHSIGLFQINDANGAGTYLLKTMSREESIVYRQNPENNCKIMLEREILARAGRNLLDRAQAGASVTELAAIFSRDIERPRDKYGAMQRRSEFALKMFGERVTNSTDEIAQRIDNGKEGYNGKGIIKLRSNQDSWILGSSGAVAMNNMKNGLNLGNTGFFGVVGISPGKFYEKLQAFWPKIEKLKLPKQIVLVGLAANGLGSNTDEAVQRNLDQYAVIKKFLEEKGVKVKIATVQPAAGLGEQISRFNDKLREKYDSDTLIDIAKHTTTADGKNINPEYASSDGIHLSRRGYETFAKLIKEGANNETDRTA